MRLFNAARYPILLALCYQQPPMSSYNFHVASAKTTLVYDLTSSSIPVILTEWDTDDKTLSIPTNPRPSFILHKNTTH